MSDKVMTKAEAVNWIINLTADIGKAEHRNLWHYEQALYEIRAMLEIDIHEEMAADAVEVVQCKDCKYYYIESGSTDVMCHRFVETESDNFGGLLMGENDYCSYGERRER